MDTIVGLWRRWRRRPDPPPVERNPGPRIQAREQAEARDRLLAQARRRNAVEYRYDRPAR